MKKNCPDFKFLKHPKLKKIVKRVIRQIVHPQLISLDLSEVRSICENKKDFEVLRYTIKCKPGWDKELQKKIKNIDLGGVSGIIVIVEGNLNLNLRELSNIGKIFGKKSKKKQITWTAHINKNIEDKVRIDIILAL